MNEIIKKAFSQIPSRYVRHNSTEIYPSLIIETVNGIRYKISRIEKNNWNMYDDTNSRVILLNSNMQLILNNINKIKNIKSISIQTLNNQKNYNETKMIYCNSKCDNISDLTNNNIEIYGLIM